MQRLLYFPLQPASDQIRLVRLRCGQFTDPIQLELMQAPLPHLRERPGYEALSYTWGDPLDTRTITLKDQPFQVTKNLEAALRNMRYKPIYGATSNDRILWIDAICINQNDIQERNRQVRRMLEIYKSALRVIVWLGEGDPDSDKAMVFMSTHSESLSSPESYSKVQMEFSKSMQYKDEWLALAQGILLRPWWSRVWIVQEVAVAKHLIVLCGNHAVSWDHLIQFEYFANQYHAPEVAQALRSTDKNSVRSAQQAAMIGSIRGNWQSGKSLMLHQLILELRLFNSTCEVDKLYAYLGLCVDADAEYLNPDYSQPTWQVYAQYTKHIIVQQKKLDFICAGNNMKATKGLPSWVPDFHKANDEIPNPLKGLGSLMEDVLYNASAKTPMSVVFSDDLRTLRATGLVVGSITALAPYWDPHLSTPDFFEKFSSAIAAWIEFILKEGASFNSKFGFDKASLALSKTLTADRLLDSKYRVTRLPPGEGALEVGSRGVPQEFEPQSDPIGRDRLYQQHVRHWLEGALMYRCLAILESGHIGLLPQIAGVGDLVCILFGCDTPVVLRPHEEEYSFIGEW